MKRIGNIFDKIISIENLTLAHKNASKGKKKQKGVKDFNKNIEANILALHEELREGNYSSPIYKMFTIFEPKERQIFIIDYPHRIVQHAILQVIGNRLTKSFVSNTYACIKGRGIHLAQINLSKALGKGYKYCLKIDVKKFYPSVDQNILLNLLRRFIKDEKVIELINTIISTSDGLAIGNYISQILGNLYLSPLDRYIKEELKLPFMSRYCDDIVMLTNDKTYLHDCRKSIEKFLKDKLNLELKGNYKVFPVKLGIDYLGYVTYPNHVKLRKTIKKNYIKAVKRNRIKSLPSYNGWLLGFDSINLRNKYENKFAENSISA